ncbi:hypothetical protein CMEL01_12634 [Colletotrichum melonis]|uniref:Uncharacterized protein n=1 Tax=Colletotrichum melonis TaxID=1209925 RepID=A0AAI9XXM7_9PEZI|nr:hypothetical protein CMEL01_12634 [Colletotrichum melonis]
MERRGCSLFSVLHQWNKDMEAVSDFRMAASTLLASCNGSMTGRIRNGRLTRMIVREIRIFSQGIRHGTAAPPTGE